VDHRGVARARADGRAARHDHETRRLLHQRGEAVDIIVATLWPRVQTWPQREREPWTETEVAALVADIAKKDAERKGAEQKQQKAEPFIFQTRTLAQLEHDVMSREEEPWLCEGWVPARGPFMVAGPSHVGKTWLMLDLR
jgi:hypothetical protein